MNSFSAQHGTVNPQAQGRVREGNSHPIVQPWVGVGRPCPHHHHHHHHAQCGGVAPHGRQWSLLPHHSRTHPPVQSHPATASHHQQSHFLPHPPHFLPHPPHHPCSSHQQQQPDTFNPLYPVHRSDMTTSYHTTAPQGRDYPHTTTPQDRGYPHTTAPQGRGYPHRTAAPQGRSYPHTTAQQGRSYPHTTAPQGRSYHHDGPQSRSFSAGGADQPLPYLQDDHVMSCDSMTTPPYPMLPPSHTHHHHSNTVWRPYSEPNRSTRFYLSDILAEPGPSEHPALQLEQATPTTSRMASFFVDRLLDDM